MTREIGDSLTVAGNLTTTGNLAAGISVAQGISHVDDGIAGRILRGVSGVAGTEVDLVAAGTFSKFVSVSLEIMDSAGGYLFVATPMGVPASGSTTYDDISGVIRVTLYSTGRLTVKRISGTRTYSMIVWLRYLK